jgi:hypothetical protein
LPLNDVAFTRVERCGRGALGAREMLKALLLVLGGLVGGLAIAFWLEPSAPPLADEGGAVPAPTSSRATDGGATAARLAALEDALAAEVEQRTALEARVAELAAELDARASPPAGALPGAAPAAGGDPAAGEALRARLRGALGARRDERRIVEQLVDAGFAPDRAEWINRRSEELRMQTLQAQYDATREGRAPEPRVGVEQTLRSEIGDADYERYLAALGRPTGVGVRDVLASSPAETSGLRAGDQIVAYDGRRVFDMRELDALTLEGTPGESVVVGVLRDGQTLQLVMPRGPIGIFGGGFRGP